MNNIWKGTLLITSILLLDQFSKGIIQKVFLLGQEKVLVHNLVSIVYVQNSATALKAFEHWDLKTKNMFLLFFSLLLILWAIRRFVFLRKEYLRSLPYVFVIAGLLGNLIDRLLYGHIVSFIKVAHWVLNFSDISIILAITFSIFNMYYFFRKKNVPRTF